MQNIRRRLGAIVAGFATVPLVAAVGFAHVTLPGQAGQGYSNGDAACFANYNSAKINTCSSAKQLVIPLPLSDYQTHEDVTVYIRGNGSVATSCHLRDCNSSASCYDYGTQSTTSTSTAAKNLGDVYLHAGDSVYVVCSVAPYRAGYGTGSVITVSAD